MGVNLGVAVLRRREFRVTFMLEEESPHYPMCILWLFIDFFYLKVRMYYISRYVG